MELPEEEAGWRAGAGCCSAAGARDAGEGGEEEADDDTDGADEDDNGATWPEDGAAGAEGLAGTPEEDEGDGARAPVDAPLAPGVI